MRGATMANDYSACKLSKRYYSGSERKLGIIKEGKEYMLKFQKKELFGYRFNHVSEYLGSHIFSILGYDVQETELGLYEGEEVVACRNFLIDNNSLFVPFNDIGESSLEQNKDEYQYDYDDIMRMLRENVKLTNVSETISMFFEIYIVAALIGNFDRHGGNWGFVKKDDRYSLAPVFDNGSCLFPQMIDENKMDMIMSSIEETNERVYKFPISQIKLYGKKSSYYEVINSLQFDECNKALVKVYEKYDKNRINSLIDATPFISEKHKEFYKYIIDQRFMKILEPAYRKLKERNLREAKSRKDGFFIRIDTDLYTKLRK